MPDSELLFKALADTTRHRLLRVLAMHELSVTELVEVLQQPQSTVSRHLRVLREAGLITDRRIGAAVHYAAVPRLPMPADPGADPAATRGGAGHGPRNGKSPSWSLRDRLLGWVAEEGVDAELNARLEAVRLRRERPGGGDFFAGLGQRWDQMRVEAFGPCFHLEALAALLPADWVVADIGTGTGYMLATLARRFKQVIAVDPVAEMLAVARRRLRGEALGRVEFRQGSLEALPIADGCLDLAIASLVLHHVPEPAGAMRELHRCLRPGGRLLIIEQEAHQIGEFHERMGDHWWGLDPQMVRVWLADAGFAAEPAMSLPGGRASASGRLSAPSLYVLVAAITGD